MNKFLYCDNAATTKPRDEVIQEVTACMQEDYGNSSSLHKLGHKAKAQLDKARSFTAKLINAEPCEIIFTSGGTESNNLAILGLSNLEGSKKRHIICSPIEHSSVYRPIKALEEKGWQVTWLKVNSEGFIDLEELNASIGVDTLFVSIMHANNEIGSIQDLKAIGEICKNKNVFFHTDAVQSAGKVSINVREMNIDLLSISGHKIYGPKGVGVLFKNKNLDLPKTILGGSQESGLKPGTENIPGIAGLGRAIELAMPEMDYEARRLRDMQEIFLKKLAQSAELKGEIKINGTQDLQRRIPGNINLSFRSIKGDIGVLQMNIQGICCSTGSACTAASIEPSRVVLQLYPEPESFWAHNTLRISLGKYNTEEELDIILKALENIVLNLRKKVAN
ncbi:MAG: cysteine desulfurase family protein, partial [Candidatus Caenarcaniphilales bacterium]|nr:cysteine desulfurase family protein [Candidatus Caenarcaniphilales bacterium]